jgi:16S rRNA (guanine1207-N2)-methyltransferase
MGGPSSAVNLSVTSIALSAGTSEAALDALHHAVSINQIVLPADGRVLFLRARDGHWWGAHSRANWVCQQSFKPFADELERSGLRVAEPGDDEKFPLVLILPPRQRDEARALYARALDHLAPGGVIAAAIANSEGAKSGEGDFRQLLGGAQVLSKHHCRVFWTAPVEADIDTALLQQWRALDRPGPVADGRHVSRPGLFAWNRVDAASALLASHLPDSMAGRVADIGAGYGYLACELLRRCAGISAIDLYEAEARAIEPARINTAAALKDAGRTVPVEVIWHDVSRGLPHRYDAIVSNPPFHQGRADQPELGIAFIDAAARALAPEGQFWMVANRHLPYEATLAARFRELCTVAIRDGFKVFAARGPRP